MKVKFIKTSLICIIGIVLTYAYLSAQGSYSIKVNLQDQVVEVFNKGVLLKEMPCSTGVKPGSTPLGKFTTYAHKEKDIWLEKDGTEVSYFYITRFKNGISFHSMLEGDSSLVREGRDLFRLRKPSSMGCVRLSKSDAKWIYNLPLGMDVEVVN